MQKFHVILGVACSLVLAHASAQQLQPTATAPVALPVPVVSASAPPVTAAELPAPIDPPVAYTGSAAPAAPIIPTAPGSAIPVSAVGSEVTGAASPAAGAAQAPVSSASGHSLNEFQGDDVAQVLRLLARQAKISLIVSDKVEAAQPPLKVTMRLENKSPIEAIKIIAESKNLIVDEKGDVYTIKTKEEKDAEPTESAFYTFSYAQAEKISPLLTAQLLKQAAAAV